MTGATITLSCDDAEVQAALTRLAAAGGNMEGAMAEIASALYSSTKERFDAQQAPDGTPWALISAAWRARKAVKGWDPRILIQRGYLGGKIPGDLVIQHDATSAQIGTSLPYGAIHQFGGEVKHGEQTLQRTLYFRTGHDEYNNKIVGTKFVPRKKSNFSQTVSVNIRAFTQKVIARPWLGLSTTDVGAIMAICGNTLQTATTNREPNAA